MDWNSCADIIPVNHQFFFTPGQLNEGLKIDTFKSMAILSSNELNLDSEIHANYLTIRASLAPQLTLFLLAKPGRKILDISVLDIDNVCIMTWVKIFGEI